MHYVAACFCPCATDIILYGSSDDEETDGVPLLGFKQISVHVFLCVVACVMPHSCKLGLNPAFASSCILH